MRQALFTITCTTCHVRLAVRSAEAVGAILECPKCGCMVPVTPPPGWQPPPKPPETPAARPLPVGTSTPSLSGGPASEPPISEPQSVGAISAAEADSTLAAAHQSAEAQSFRFWHSWQFAVAAPISAAAIAIVVWLTMFPGVAPDTSAGPRRANSKTDVPADAAGPQQNENNPQPPEQTAAVDKNDSTQGTLNPDVKSAEKSGANAAQEKSADAKPQSGPESPRIQTCRP